MVPVFVEAGVGSSRSGRNASDGLQVGPPIPRAGSFFPCPFEGHVLQEVAPNAPLILCPQEDRCRHPPRQPEFAPALGARHLGRGRSIRSRSSSVPPASAGPPGALGRTFCDPCHPAIAGQAGGELSGAMESNVLDLGAGFRVRSVGGRGAEPSLRQRGDWNHGPDGRLVHHVGPRVLGGMAPGALFPDLLGDLRGRIGIAPSAGPLVPGSAIIHRPPSNHRTPRDGEPPTPWGFGPHALRVRGVYADGW